jgi:lantibiotic biosynthesis protein
MPPRRAIPASLAPASLAAEALAAARQIAGELAAAALRDPPPDPSLRGSSGVWLLVHELGADAPAIPRAAARRWEDAAVAALATLDASFFDGMLGCAWLLARLGRAAGELAAVDEAVLDVLGGRWDGGLAAFGGGLAGFGSYGLARTRTRAGRRIVRRCVALFGELAHRDGRAAWWAPGAAALPAALRDRPPPLANREGSAAAVGFLAAASRVAPAALPLARRGARTLAAELARASHAGIGVVTAHAAPGLVHGSGSWALGGAGAVGALVAVARATRDFTAAARCGRLLADLDPDACGASDASLGTGTAGIACVLQALAEATREPVFAFAAEHWHRRTLRCRRPGEGLGGYLHCAPLASAAAGGGRWAPRPGLLDGAAGTALSLLCAARGARASPWLAPCLLA